jgi:Iron-containing redox enzyme
MHTELSVDVASDFIAGRRGLSYLIRSVIAMESPFDDQLRRNSALDAALQSQVRAIVARARREPSAAHELHSVLNTLYSMRIRPEGSVQELSVTLFDVRRRLESAWLGWELERCAEESLPATVGGFSEWFFALTRMHPAARHPLYEYIAHEATVASFRVFIAHESTVDARFDDLLALAQLGVTGPPKLEIARNYWDELGNGEASRVHTDMFRRVFDAVGFAEPDEQELDTTALSCGNLLLALASHRIHTDYAIGALGITEALAPRRFARVLQAGERLGIGSHPLEYFREHVSIDVHHTRQWIENVIEPRLRTRPSALHQVCCGVLMRLNTSLAYCDTLLSRLKQTDQSMPNGTAEIEGIRRHA